MIGGDYCLKQPARFEDSLGELLVGGLGHISFFASGRDALTSLLAALPQASVSPPDLMCAAVYDACRAAGKKVNVYSIGRDFLHEDTATRVAAQSIVFVMHYFGLRNETLLRLTRIAGSTVISDATHLLFDRAGLLEVARQSDFLIASLRKSGPFPDGGFVSSLQHRLPLPTRGLREEFLALRAAGLWSRGFSAEQGFPDEEKLRLLKLAEASLDASLPSDFSCSYLSCRQADTVPISASAAAIRRNVGVLSSGLRRYAVVPETTSLISPFFPCIFGSGELRDHVQGVLASNRFFFPVH